MGNVSVSGYVWFKELELLGTVRTPLTNTICPGLTMCLLWGWNCQMSFKHDAKSSFGGNSHCLFASETMNIIGDTTVHLQNLWDICISSRIHSRYHPTVVQERDKVKSRLLIWTWSTDNKLKTFQYPENHNISRIVKKHKDDGHTSQSEARTISRWGWRVTGESNQGLENNKAQLKIMLPNMNWNKEAWEQTGLNRQNN